MITCPRCHHAFAPAHHPLTKRQRELFVFVERFTRSNGFAPSYEEIAANFGYSSLATVHEHLQNLQKKGVLAVEYNASRGITLLLRSDELGDPPTATGEDGD